MATADTLAQLRSRILSHFSMMFLTTWEEERWEAELAALATEMDRGLVTWTVTRGAQPPLAADSSLLDPEEFLRRVPDFPREQLFLLKDFRPYLADPRIVRQLRDLAPTLIEQRQSLLFMGP